MSLRWQKCSSTIFERSLCWQAARRRLPRHRCAAPITYPSSLTRPLLKKWNEVGTKMDRQIAGVLYAVAMVALIVGVDLLFLRDRFWERLIVNIGIVLVFGAFYLKFLAPSE